MKYLFFLLGLSLLSSCSSSSYLSFLNPKKQNTLELEELQLELADVKHTLNSYRVELEILEEKIQNGSNEITKAGKKSPLTLHQLYQQLAALEKKITLLNQSQETTLQDLKQLSTHAHQTTKALGQYKNKIELFEKECVQNTHQLDEIVKLKSTLSTLTETLQSGSISESTYKVHTGDTLGKIAHDHHTTIEAIKQRNQLENDRIFPGQLLTIPHGS